MNLWADWIDGKAGTECRAENIGKPAVPQQREADLANRYARIHDWESKWGNTRLALDAALDCIAELQAAVNKRGLAIARLEARIVSEIARAGIEREVADKRLYAESLRGSEARGVIAEIATVVGVNLGEGVLGGSRWSVANMRRVSGKVERNDQWRRVALRGAQIVVSQLGSAS